MKRFRKRDEDEKDIRGLNLVSRYGLVKPGYRQDLSRRRLLEFAYLPDGETLVLLGSMDGSYPYWISETDIGDTQTNTAIVESMLHKDFSSFTGMNGELFRKLKDGEFGLLNKVTMGETIRSGLRLQRAESGYDMTRYKRTGLTLIRYMENSIPVQELAVRKAIALCFDRERYIQEYAGPAGVRMDAFCGIGQWMYRLAKGQMVVSGELAEKIGEEAITLDGVKQYGFSIAEAKKKLADAGWTLNENGGRYEEGVRYKEINGELVGLKLTMGMPESGEARDLLERYLLPNLEEAGIQLALKPVDMELIEKNYEEKSTYDLLYLGENFSIYFDTQLMAPDEDYSGNLTDCRRELAIMARKMVRTEPTDVVSFMKKWVELQEKISETLPVLPVYSNDYFDFYTRELHQYRITDAVTGMK